MGIYTVKDPKRLRIGLAFWARVTGGKIGLQDSEIAELRWFDKKEVAELIKSGNLHGQEYGRRSLADYLTGQFFPLCVLDEGP